MHEKELKGSALFTNSVTDAILDTLRAISQDVFNVVGFLDTEHLIAIFYEVSDTANMKRDPSSLLSILKLTFRHL
jgi:hypothetical protein